MRGFRSIASVWRKFTNALTLGVSCPQAQTVDVGANDLSVVICWRRGVSWLISSCELMPYHRCMAELVFEVVQESDGGYCAECLTESIFT
jgi:hypothetical protein